MIKLTESQMYNLSIIIYNSNNNIEMNESKFNCKIIHNLYNKNLIQFGAFNNVLPTEKGVEEYINNIGKKVFRNRKEHDIKIQIYSKDKTTNNYNFTYFFCSTTGGGIISSEELMKYYILYKQ